MQPTTLHDFYQTTCPATETAPGFDLTAALGREIGHFNVFRTADLARGAKGKREMPYNRRTYYKVSLIVGPSRVEYADKVIEVERQGLLFGTPKVPYNYVPLGDTLDGQFCIFTDEFLTPTKSGLAVDELPIFQAGGYPVFQLSDEERTEIEAVFAKMHREISSDYAYKYDLLRALLLELIHYGQKLQPVSAVRETSSASARVSTMFVELMERQFPVSSPRQKLKLRTAKDYADRLAVHVNHLNKVLKETTGLTTTNLIAQRVAREAKILLKQTDWNVSEIAWSLGFEEVAHFSNFFRKQTAMSPMAYRA